MRKLPIVLCLLVLTLAGGNAALDAVPPAEAASSSDERAAERSRRAATASAARAERWQPRGDSLSFAGPPLRRMTQFEYANALEDLLGIDGAAAAYASEALPPEADSGGFDTVAEHQGMSALHIRSYLAAADRALDAGLRLGPQPEAIDFTINYAQAMVFYATAEIFGLGVVKLLDDAAVQFADPVCTYTMDTERNGFRVPLEGRYRVTMEGYRHQADTLVVMNLFRGTTQGIVASLDELLGSWDLVDDEVKKVSVETFLQPGDLLAPCIAEAEEKPGDSFFQYYEADKFAQDFTGEGVAFRYLRIEGPLNEQWPPASVGNLLPGVVVDENGALQLDRSEAEHLEGVVRDFAPRAFRRPLDPREERALVRLGLEVLEQGRPFEEAVRVSLRAILASPQFLYQLGGFRVADDYDFATRLAAFLWRGAPDDTLVELASQGLLSDSNAVAEQVERMLDDPRSHRLVSDFAGQSWRLHEFNLTTPNQFQFPRYSAQLGDAMVAETELFLATLIAEDLGAANLIDSEFTHVNRVLAELYGIDGIVGGEMQRITLPEDSLRGGLLTQAAILKITSNGTTTSPIPRGNFVLEHLLGTPVPPPPPGIPGLEPDTRGTSTIREQLEAHRANPTCNACHRMIDPPGFALESFDAIGELRTTYNNGRAVDPSGVTPGGEAFTDVRDYKSLLADGNVEQVARHMISEMLVFATGHELERDSRREVERIMDELRADGFGVRSMIHEIAASELFRKKQTRRERGERGGAGGGLFGGSRR